MKRLVVLIEGKKKKKNTIFKAIQCLCLLRMMTYNWALESVSLLASEKYFDTVLDGEHVTFVFSSVSQEHVKLC